MQRFLLLCLAAGLATHPVAAPAQHASAPSSTGDIAPTREDHALLLGKLLGDDAQDAGTARWIVELAEQWRSRFGDHPWAHPEMARHVSAARLRRLALVCWLSGHDELAFRIAEEGLLGPFDEEERHDPWIAGFIAVTGRTERALEDLEKKGAAMDAGLRAIKRMHLQRAAGRGREALEAPWPDRPPFSLLEIAVAGKDWASAWKMTPDAAQKDLVRQFIAIVSQDPALAGRVDPPSNRTLQLLADSESSFVRQALSSLGGHPVQDADLRAMAMDAVRAAAYEARLTQALSAREPVPLEVLEEYLRHVDLLPDRERSARLAIALAEAPLCRSISGFPPGTPADEAAETAHRWVAAEALIRLGRGDASFAALLPLLARDPSLTQEPGRSGYFTEPLVAAWRQGLLLASAAWPSATPSERIERLSSIAALADPRQRAEAMIALARDHGSALGKKELLRWLWLPLADLAHGDGVPDEVFTAAGSLLETRQPDDADLARLDNARRPPAAVDQSLARAKAGVGDLETKFDPAPLGPLPLRPPPTGFQDPALASLPGKWDPKKEDFQVYDSLCALKLLLEAQRRDLADPLMNHLLARLTLDDSLAGQSVTVTTQTRNGSFSSRRTVRAPELIMTCHAAWNFPAEWLSPCVAICCHGQTGYHDGERLRAASIACEKAGKIEQAEDLQRQFLLVTLSPEANDPVIEPPQVATLVRLEMLSTSRRGDRDAFLNRLRGYLRLMPYHPEAVGRALAEWAGDSPAPRIDVAAAVGMYWDAKALEVPDSRTYAHWRKRWMDEIGAP